MATGLYIDARQLQKGAKGFDRLIKEFPDKISYVLDGAADEIVRNAKRAAPKDRGETQQGISADISKPLSKQITSRAPHSAWIEFGTGKYAAQYVSTLPAEYAAYAAQFKTGSKKFPPIKVIAEWVKRKGLAGTYSIKTKRRTGNKATREKQDLQVAYLIARAIFINGVHPHPFMIPALIAQAPKINRDLTALLNKLKIV